MWPCLDGTWICTSEEAYYEHFRFGLRPGCPVSNVDPPTPPPGHRCLLINGTCQYAVSSLECTTSVQSCSDGYICGPTQGAKLNTNTVTPPVPNCEPPLPDMLCLPINDTCQWYNPCRYWRGYCFSPYQCGTADEYYAFMFGPQPLCAPAGGLLTEPIAPGDCVVRDQDCRWSSKFKIKITL